MKAVIFDMDGVVVDSEPLHTQHLRQFLTEIGVSNPQSFTTSLKGVSAHDTWRLLREAFDLRNEVSELTV